MITITIEISDTEWSQCLFCGIRDETGDMIETHNISSETLLDKKTILCALPFIENENIKDIIHD